jgi:hypothetical protein
MIWAWRYCPDLDTAALSMPQFGRGFDVRRCEVVIVRIGRNLEVGLAVELVQGVQPGVK